MSSEEVKNRLLGATQSHLTADGSQKAACPFLVVPCHHPWRISESYCFELFAPLAEGQVIPEYRSILEAGVEDFLSNGKFRHADSPIMAMVLLLYYTVLLYVHVPRSRVGFVHTHIGAWSSVHKYGIFILIPIIVFKY